MRWLRSIARRIGRRFGLYDDGKTEIHKRRAVRDAPIERVYSNNSKGHITKP